MIKKLFIVIFLSIFLFAEEAYRLKLFEKVLPSIFQHRPIKIYTDFDIGELLKNSSYFDIVDYCDDDVDLLVGKDFEYMPHECENKPIFTTSYKMFKNNKNSFGAFYWRKGRPQLRFNKDVLKDFNITLPESMQKYIK